MDNELKKIVQEASQEVSKDLFDQETINKEIASLSASDDEDYLNNVFSFVINTSTSYSSSVLLNVLERLESKGYLKV